MKSVPIRCRFKWNFLVFMTFMCTCTYSDLGKNSPSQNLFSNSEQTKFVTKNNTLVIAQKGGLAILPCVLRLNSPATVSWIRRKDFQLLTVGLSTHSTDKRFLIEHARHMGHWSLRIKSVREEDRGFYECQLSIYPTQSIFIELRVVEAVADILSAPDLHINEGSALQLHCKLKRATENPAFVFWYHNNKMVNYDSQDGFSVISSTANSPLNTDTSLLFDKKSNNHKKMLRGTANNEDNRYVNNTKNALSSEKTKQNQSLFLMAPFKSVLTIKEVFLRHEGNYTCAPSNARSASITVHVLRGEKPAAMQHGNRSVLDSETSYDVNNGNSTNSAHKLYYYCYMEALTWVNSIRFVQIHLITYTCVLKNVLIKAISLSSLVFFRLSYSEIVVELNNILRLM